MVFVLGSGITLALLNADGKTFFCMHDWQIYVSVWATQGKAIFRSLKLIPSQPVAFSLSVFEIDTPACNTPIGGIENVALWEVRLMQKFSNLSRQLYWDPSVWSSGKNLETTDKQMGVEDVWCEFWRRRRRRRRTKSRRRRRRKKNKMKNRKLKRKWKKSKTETNWNEKAGKETEKIERAKKRRQIKPHQFLKDTFPVLSNPLLGLIVSGLSEKIDEDAKVNGQKLSHEMQWSDILKFFVAVAGW